MARCPKQYPNQEILYSPTELILIFEETLLARRKECLLDKKNGHPYGCPL
jgi:hypothetical protein